MERGAWSTESSTGVWSEQSSTFGSDSVSDSVHDDKWNLIWFHKKCLQAETQQLRHGLVKELAKSGGVLLCLKNAGRLIAFLDDVDQPVRPTILLMDWREAKPCAKVLAEQRRAWPRLLVVVYTETEKQRLMAERWAAHLPEQGAFTRKEVRVIGELGSSWALVDRLHDLWHSATDERSWELCYDPKSDDGVAALNLVAQPVSYVCVTFVAQQEPPQHAQTRDKDAFCPGFMSRQAQRSQWAQPVATLMHQAFPTESMCEVKNMLQAAEPSSYND